MKIIKATALASLMLASLAAHAATPSVSISVSGEISPGVYGQVQFGNVMPPMVLLHSQPVIILRQPSAVVIAPLYLHVPPGHAKNWAKHCGKYNACGKPVYFMMSEDYGQDYQERKGKGHKNKGNKDKGNKD